MEIFIILIKFEILSDSLPRTTACAIYTFRWVVASHIARVPEEYFGMVFEIVEDEKECFVALKKSVLWP